MAVREHFKRLAVVQWISCYRRDYLLRDGIAAAIVTILLIPQSLAYAMLAGVPPQVGLYASILPLVGYALFGSSRTLSVGPVAIISLMTATALGDVAVQGVAGYLMAATTLALLSGMILFAMALLKLGFISNFLSHPVISGFITASSMLIALNQIQHVLSIQMKGDTVIDFLPSLLLNLGEVHWPTVAVGAFTLGFLYLAKSFFPIWLHGLGIGRPTASLLARTAPIFAVLLGITAAYQLNLGNSGVALTGEIPAGLPSLSLSLPSLELVEALLLPALLISIIGFVESISLGKTLASKRRHRVDADQELLGLGAANLASAISGGIPVAGGFSRSLVNFDAGAATQAASIMTAAGVALASLLLTPALYYLPKATLAATIIVAVIPLIDISILRQTWRFSRSDFAAVTATIIITLLLGVETGVAGGVGISIALHLYRTSRPHIAEVGLIGGTEHFRNIHRYHVETVPAILTLRPDESLFFANAGYLAERVQEAVYGRDAIEHVILQCSAVNELDYSALEMLEELNYQLADQGIRLHLSEVKGPVMDRLQATRLLDHLSGQVFVSQFEAFDSLKAGLR